MKIHFSVSGPKQASASDVPQKMTYRDDKLNALIMSLDMYHMCWLKGMKRGQKSNMAVAGDESSKFRIEKVNRGGLFPVNDDSFCLFLFGSQVNSSPLALYHIQEHQHTRRQYKKKHDRSLFKKWASATKWSAIPKDVLKYQIIY